ncbi:MAG: hypothetical protein ACI9VT_003067 [Psychroserpens sp.]|jgi:hypothetical protein
MFEKHLIWLIKSVVLIMNLGTFNDIFYLYLKALYKKSNCVFFQSFDAEPVLYLSDGCILCAGRHKKGNRSYLFTEDKSIKEKI